MFYKYNDQAFSFVRGLGIYKDINFFPLLDFKSDSRGIDPFFRFIMDLLSQYITPFQLNYILIVISFVLTLYFSYKLFMFITKSNHVSLVFALFNATSLYYLYRVVSATQNLYFVFVFPLIFLLLLKKKTPLIVAILTFFIFGFVSYYAYFIAVVVGIWYFAEYLTKEIAFSGFIKKSVLFVSILLLGFVLFYRDLFLSNISIFNNNYSDTSISNTDTVYRPIEDWYNFSFRPWYFVLPPESSIFFGDLSSKVFDYIKSSGHYLADDYMSDEMAGTYMGWHWLLGLLFILVFRSPFTIEQKKFFLVLVFVLLITLPPSFVINGFEIYTPSYVFYSVVPVFRTIVRWSAVIYLLILMLNAYLFSKLSIGKTVALVVLNTLVFAVWIPLIDLKQIPSEISYLQSLENRPARILVYPDANFYSVFWATIHENKILNPSGIAEYPKGLDHKIVTEQALNNNLNYDFDYVVIYFDRIKESDKLYVLPKIEQIGIQVYSSPSTAIYKKIK